jgi:hypothetical protein
MENNIEWIATWVSIACSVFRALNLGYQGWVYLVSVATYITFICFATKRSQVVLNVFYIVTAVIGAYRWGLH